MSVIKVQVKNRVAINVTPDIEIVCKNDGYEVEFEFDEIWEASNIKTALFITPNGTMAIPFNGIKCAIPAIENTELLGIGVKSNDVAGLHTSNTAYVKCLLSADDEGNLEIEPPEQSVYDRIISMLNEYIEMGAMTREEVADIIKEETSELQPKLDETLQTNDKTIVGAINEVNEKAEQGGGAKNIVFDGEYNEQTNKAATVQTVTNKIAEVIANAPEAYDTLEEIARWISEHPGSIAELNAKIQTNTEEIAKRAKIADMDLLVRSGIINNQYSLDNYQKQNACAWLGAVRKISSMGEGILLYAEQDGNTTTIPLNPTSSAPNSIVCRDEYGDIQSKRFFRTETGYFEENEAITLGFFENQRLLIDKRIEDYVDLVLGDIDNALDGIIDIQDALIWRVE